MLPAGAPKGYIVVNSGALTAANGTQTFGSAACPAKTVVYGGGVIITSSSLAANVNTSWPDGDTDWAADVNNASGAATTFTVYAICAHKPKGYKVIESGGVVNPAGSQNVAVAYCPSGLKVFGGGGYSTSGSTSGQHEHLDPRFAHPSQALRVGSRHEQRQHR